MADPHFAGRISVFFAYYIAGKLYSEVSKPLYANWYSMCRNTETYLRPSYNSLNRRLLATLKIARAMLQNGIDCSTVMKMIGLMENDPALRIFS